MALFESVQISVSDRIELCSEISIYSKRPPPSLIMEKSDLQAVKIGLGHFGMFHVSELGIKLLTFL